MAQNEQSAPDRLKGIIFAIDDSLSGGIRPRLSLYAMEYRERITNTMFHAFLRQKYEQNRDAALNFKLPKSSLVDHLRDCFEWKRPPDRFDAFHRCLAEMYRRAHPLTPRPRGQGAKDVFGNGVKAIGRTCNDCRAGK